MGSGGRGKRGGLLTMVALLVMAGLVMLTVAGCGGDDSADVSSTTAAASPGPSETSQAAAQGDGVLVAEEILGVFDEIVGKAAELAKGKPEPTVLKPQLMELYDSYMPKMTELNKKYLGLRDSDTVQWGACNSHLGENRGKHVFDKDSILTEALQYYNLELGDQEIVDLLSKKPVELLDVAVKQ